MQVLQCGEDVWMPSGGASISTAAAADNVVVASCTHFKVSSTQSNIIKISAFSSQLLP